MAHYAFIDSNNKVVEVITGRNEDEIIDGISNWEEWYGQFRGLKCLRTSYNNRIRHKFAQIGDFYDEVNDVFIAPQPYASWTLNENYDWDAPVPCPTEGFWIWSEEEGNWVEVPAGS